MQKTNAMRILDSKKIKYSITEYDVSDGRLDGVSVANKVGKDPAEVFKTLVAGFKQELFVFVIPVCKELDMKKAAKCTEKKSIEMIPQKQLLPSTGYVHGGCTAIGMKKNYPVFLDASAEGLKELTVSGGKIGMQITLTTADYLSACGAKLCDLAKEN